MATNFSGASPIYGQIVDIFERDIASGRLLPGSRLPPVRELALEMKVNPNTMQRAMQALELSGLVYTERTSGRFVTTDIMQIGVLKERLSGSVLDLFISSMRQMGYGKTESIALINEHWRENENG